MLFRIALRNLLLHRRRTAMLTFALALVMTLLVSMMALTNAVDRAMFDAFTGLFSGHVNVEGFFKVSQARSFAAVTDVPRLMAIIKREVPEAEEVLQRGRGWVKIIGPARTLQMGIVGTDIASDRRLRSVLQMEQGSLDGLSENNTIVIFDFHAKKLGVGVGDMLTLSAPNIRGTYNTEDVRIVGIARSIGALSQTFMFVPSATTRRLFGFGETTTGALLIYLKDPSEADAVHLRLRRVLAREGYRLMEDDPRIYFFKTEKVNAEDWTGQKLDVTTYRAAMSLFDWFIAVLRGVSVVVCVLLLAVIVVGLMNSLWISITDRTPEIGTLRAIGMHRTRVMWMFMYEALVISAAGGIAGSLLGISTCGLVNALHLPVPRALEPLLMTSSITMQPSLPFTLFAIGSVMACMTLFAAWPSLHAARMQPNLAIQKSE